MELMALRVVGFYKCPAAGDVVDASVDMEPIDRLVGGLSDLYCRVFLQVTVVPFVLELSVGFGHVVRCVLNHHSPSLVCRADPDNPLGHHFPELAQCCSRFWTRVVMVTSRTLVDVCATLYHSRCPDLCLSLRVVHNQSAYKVWVARSLRPCLGQGIACLVHV